MNGKKQSLIEIFFLTLIFLIFIISFQLQDFVIIILLLTSFAVVVFHKKEIKKKILPQKMKYFLNMIYLDTLVIISLILLFGSNFILEEINFKKFVFTFYLLLFYLFFSVIPQEIIFRFLFFYRYKNYFNNFQIILINSFLFSLCHVIYFDIYILLFSLFGNLLFTYNYIKNKSLLLVIIEHFFFGQTIIILGFYDNFNYSIIKKLYNLVLIN